MPRDPAGNATLYSPGNPVVSGTVIASSWANNTLSDIAAMMTDSLSRTGLGGMLSPFRLVDGSTSAPAFSFQNESNTGFYRAGPGDMEVVVGSAKQSRWTSDGFQGTVDGGSTWKFPIYQNLAGQTITSGTVDFTGGTLLVNGAGVYPPTTTASSSTGSSSTTATSFTAVTNANLTFTANGNPVLVQLVADDTSNDSVIGCTSSVNGGPSVNAFGYLALSADGGSTFFAIQRVGGFAVWSGVGPVYYTNQIPASAFAAVYTPAAGSGKTIGLYAKCSGSNQAVFVNNAKLRILQG